MALKEALLFLRRNATLVLVLYFMWKLLLSFSVWAKAYKWLQRNCRRRSFCPEILSKISSVTEWFHQRCRDWQQETVEQRAGVGREVFVRPQDTVPQSAWTSIRQLLCNDVACKVCERAASEASRLIYSHGAGSRGPTDRRALLSSVPCVQCPFLPDVSVQRGHKSFPWSSSEPAPISGQAHLAPVRPASCSKSLHFPSLPMEEGEEMLLVAERTPRSSKESSRCSGDRDEQAEELVSSSATTYETSLVSWTESTSGLSGFSVCSLKDHRSTRHHKVSHKHRKGYKGSRWVDGEAIAESQMSDDQRDSFCLRMRTYSQSSLSESSSSTGRKRMGPGVGKKAPSKAHAPSALLPCRAQEIKFTSVDVPFVEEGVVASLELHLLAKRVQHLLGLLSALLRSFMNFMPSAPCFASRRLLWEVAVVTSPQALSFVAGRAKKKLEVHLKKMVQLKRWQLPQRVQEALRHMKPPFQPRVEKTPSAVWQQRPRATGQVKNVRKMPKTVERLPNTAEILDSKTTQGSQAKLQVHLMKKSVEMRLEVFPIMTWRSQKVTNARVRDWSLPKLIPSGRNCPRLRNRLCLSLRGKADPVEMNIKCKYIHFLWGLPTLYMQSLAKIVPSAPEHPVVPSWVHTFTAFQHKEPPFVPLDDWKSLESHVLRKRLQHHWGLPGLVQKSLRWFLLPTPPSPTHSAPVVCVQLEVQIVIDTSQLLFICLEIKQQLETHLRSKIVERRWGLPRRVLESLKAFIPVSPPLIMRRREDRKTVALPPTTSTPSTVMPSLSKKPVASSKECCSEPSWAWKQQMLQRHLAKRLLEIQLGTVAPAIRRSQIAARRALQHELPKLIPPGSRPLKPRSQQILFLDLQALGRIQLNATHKELVYHWGLPTTYNKSLAKLFQDTVVPAAPAAILPSKSATFGFSSRVIRFICPESREELEWHVRRKTLQHDWGLPGLIQRSLQFLLPTSPRVRLLKAGTREVSISPTELSFLSKATQRKLERNVQRRVIHQRWLLPRRVLDSVRLLSPRSRLGGVTGPEPWGLGARSREQRRKKAQRRVAPASQLLPAQPAEVQAMLQLHLAKKCLELHLELLPAAVRVSWRCMSLAQRRPLPKMICPGHKPLLPRRPLPLFACTEMINRIDVAVQRNHLASLWELGAHYVEALRGMRCPRPLPQPPRWRTTAFAFSEVQMTILPETDRDTLELHVKRKWVQHEWGFPVLIQRSLRRLMCEPPSVRRPRQARVCDHVLVQDLLFLPSSICNHLEFHMQKMKLHHLWGLPRRVAESLRMLHPEVKADAPKQKPAFAQVGKSTSRKTSCENLPVSPVVGTLCTVCCKRRTAATSRGFPTIGSKDLEKIRLHQAKKCVEVQLEVFPAVAVRSWRCTVLMSRQPLPKLVLCDKPLEPRKFFLPFVNAEDAKKMEVSVQRCHLSSLCGLGKLYVEALSAMTPALHSHPLRCRKAAFKFSQVQTFFLRQRDRESLERHVRKKKLQHAWGFPAFVQRSLRAFVQDFPPGGAFRKTKTHVQIMHQELLLLPQSARIRLEHHVQRLKLQQQWGVPRRVLESLQLLFPGKKTLSVGRSPLESSSGTCTKPWAAGAISIRQDGWKARRMEGVASHQAQLCCPLRAKAIEKLQLHLRKKSLEVHLEVFPAVSRLSWQSASLTLSRPLPRPIHPGFVPLTPRSSFLSFSLMEMGQIELALQRSYFASLWGLGTRYVEAVAGMGPRLPFPPARLRGAAFEFSAVQTLFFQRPAREDLELHIKKKRMQHEWEFPALVQKSLRGFMQGTAMPMPLRLAKTVIQICVFHQELLFIPRGSCSHLEFHIQRMKLQRRWGLPRRVLESLKCFLPAAPPGRSQFPQRSKERKLAKAEFSTTGSQTSKARQRESYNVPPKKKGSLENHFRDTLENHLKKKALEIKFQLMVGCKALAGPIKPAPLPKPSSLSSAARPRRPCLLFVEQQAVAKIQLNIKHKYLTCLWGLPSLHAKSLKKMCGSVLGRPLPGTVTTVRGSMKVSTHRKEATERAKSRVSGATGFEPSKWGASFLTRESLDLLEVHIRHKKLQHEWSLPSMIQKSLCAFSPFSKPQRPSRGLHVATTRSWRSVDVKVITTQRLVFLDPVTAGRLEAHVKSQMAAHRWGLPKRVQELLKMLLPPEALPPQVEGSSSHAQIPLCTCKQVPQTAVIQAQGTLEKELEGDQQILLQTGGPPTKLSPRGMHQDKIPRHGRKTPKATLDGETKAAVCLTSEAREHLEFHIRRKRVQHDLGLPSVVQKSLRAFAPLPPEPQGSAKARAVVFVTPERLGGQGKGSAAAQLPRSMIEVMLPCHLLHFLSTSVKNYLEAHMRSWATEHKWRLIPQLIRHSVRASLPAQHKSHAGERRHHSQPSKHHQESHQRHEIHSHSEGVESLALRSSRKASPPKPKVHQKKHRSARSVGSKTTAYLSPEVKLPFLPHEALNLLEFHIIHKKIQHAWGMPSAVQKSLAALAPFPLLSEKHTGKYTAKKHPWDKGGLQAIAQNLSFLSPDTKECLEAHMRSMATKHRWETPKRVQQSLRAFLPPGAASRTEVVQGQPLFPCQCKSFRVATDDSQTEDDREDSRQGEKARRTVGKKQKTFYQGKQGTTTPVSSKVNVFLFPEVKLPFLLHEARNLLELHVQHKKLQHAWGLPSNVLKSLRAFAPLPFESQKQPPGKVVACKLYPQHKGDVQTITRSLVFLSTDIKERLDAHLRHMTEKHRWGLPERVQQSLRAFMPSAPSSRSELGQSPHRLPHPSKSFQAVSDSEAEDEDQMIVALSGTEDDNQVVAADSGTEGDNEDSLQEAKSRREAMAESKLKGEVATTTPAHAEETTFLFLEMKLTFFTDDGRNVLEFHIQRKKLQHAWGLPSTVLKSLYAFAPFPLQKHTRQSTTEERPKDSGIVHIATQSPLFLSTDFKERLDAHLRHMIEKHRWGLPERVQQSLRAFMPSIPASQPELGQSQHCLPHPSTSFQPVVDSETEDEDHMVAADSGAEGDNENSLQEAKPSREAMEKPKGKLYHKREVAAAPGHAEATMSLFLEVKRPFLPAEARNLLEFHAQHKKLQHAWGLPSNVLKSLHAFAPLPFSISAGEQSWRQREESAGKGQEAEGGSSSLLSEDNECQNSGLSSGESIRGVPQQLPALAERCPRPLAVAEGAQQCRLCISQQALHFVPQSSHVIESHSSYEDIVARDYRPPGRGRRAKPSSKLRKGGRKVGWGREKRKELPSQTLGDAAFATDMGSQASSTARAPREWSSESLCMECRSLKSASLPEGSGEDSKGHLVHQGAQGFEEGRETSSDGSGDSRQMPPVSQNQSFPAAEEESQRYPAPGLLLHADDGMMVEGWEGGGTSPVPEEQRPVSMEGMSQFSTECEWQEVGDWGSDEEGIGDDDPLGKEEEEGGSSSSGQGAEEAAGEERERFRRADSPAARQPQASPENIVPSSAVSLREARSILSNMTLRVMAAEQSEHLLAPHQATAEAVTEVLMPRGPSPASSRSVVFWGDMKTSVNIEQLETLGYGNKRQRGVSGEPWPTARPKLRRHRRAEGDEDLLSLGSEVSQEEPPAVGHDSNLLFGTPSGGDVPRTEQALSRGSGGGHPPQFLGNASSVEKVSILGTILERKLSLQQGLRILRWSGERPGLAPHSETQGTGKHV